MQTKEIITPPIQKRKRRSLMGRGKEDLLFQPIDRSHNYMLELSGKNTDAGDVCMPKFDEFTSDLSEIPSNKLKELSQLIFVYAEAVKEGQEVDCIPGDFVNKNIGAIYDRKRDKVVLVNSNFQCIEIDDKEETMLKIYDRSKYDIR